MPKASDKQATPDATEYIVQSMVDHDNQRYQIGDAIKLTAEQAGPLLAVGAILPAGAVVGS